MRMNEPKEKTSRANGDESSKAVRITPEGRRVVNPMTIVGSDEARKHLKDIRGIVPEKKG